MTSATNARADSRQAMVIRKMANLMSRIDAEVLLVANSELILLVKDSRIDAAFMKSSPPSSESVLFVGALWNIFSFEFIYIGQVTLNGGAGWVKVKSGECMA